MTIENPTLRLVLNLVSKYSSPLVFVAILILAALASERFYSYENIMNVLRQSAPLGIVACGMLLVILTGGIDLAVGSVLALSSVVAALMIPDCGMFVSVMLAIGAGAMVGVISGGMVALGNMAPFVATLAMMTIARGVALIVSKGQPLFIQDMSWVAFGSGSWLGLPLPSLVMLAVFILTGFLLKWTAFGRIVIAIGSNEVAASLAGLGTRRYKFIVYVLCGAACGLAAVIASTRTGVGSPILGLGFELDAIAAVVVGGASLSGGRGTAFNTLLGVLTLGVISNIMNLLNIPGYHQQVVKGVIIALAVLGEGLKTRRAR